MKSHEQVVQNIKDLGGSITSGTFLHAACMLPCRAILHYTEEVDELAVATQVVNDGGEVSCCEGQYFKASEPEDVAAALEAYADRVKSIINGTLPSVAHRVRTDDLDSRMPFVRIL